MNCISHDKQLSNTFDLKLTALTSQSPLVKRASLRYLRIE